MNLVVPTLRARNVIDVPRNWQALGDNHTVLHRRFLPSFSSSSTARNQPFAEYDWPIAAFDLDGTLMHKTAGVDMYPSVIPRLKSLLREEGFAALVVFSNENLQQLGSPAVIIRTLERKTRFIEAFAERLDEPLEVFVALAHDEYRKPNTSMWTKLYGGRGLSSGKTFFCGDAAKEGSFYFAHLGDKASDYYDEEFARRLQVKFVLPRNMFTGPQYRKWGNKTDTALSRRRGWIETGYFGGENVVEEGEEDEDAVSPPPLEDTTTVLGKEEEETFESSTKRMRKEESETAGSSTPLMASDLSSVEDVARTKKEDIDEDSLIDVAIGSIATETFGFDRTRAGNIFFNRARKYLESHPDVRIHFLEASSAKPSSTLMTNTISSSSTTSSSSNDARTSTVAATVETLKHRVEGDETKKGYGDSPSRTSWTSRLLTALIDSTTSPLLPYLVSHSVQIFAFNGDHLFNHASDPLSLALHREYSGLHAALDGAYNGGPAVEGLAYAVPREACGGSRNPEHSSLRLLVHVRGPNPGNPDKKDFINGDYAKAEPILDRCYESVFVEIERYARTLRTTSRPQASPTSSSLHLVGSTKIDTNTAGMEHIDTLASWKQRLERVPRTYSHPSVTPPKCVDAGGNLSLARYVEAARAPSPALKPYERFFWHREEGLALVIYDGYPKASVHLLAIPLADLRCDANPPGSIYDLVPQSLPQLKRFHEYLSKIAERLKERSKGAGMAVGYHVAPSLGVMHAHIISKDLYNSPHVKTRKHWQSFTKIPGLFLPSHELERQLGETGPLRRPAPATVEVWMRSDFTCPKCFKSFDSLVNAKAHRC